MKVPYIEKRQIEVEIHVDECPFCEEKEAFEIRCDGLFGHVFCRQCGAFGPYGQGLEGAVRVWNKPRTREDFLKER